MAICYEILLIGRLIVTKLWKGADWALVIELTVISIGIYIYRWAMILLWAAYGR